MQGTVPEIQVDQALIGHVELFGQRLEIRYGRFVKPNCDPLLKLLGVGILLPFHLAEIVMFSHGSTPVLGLLTFVRFPRGDDSNYRIVFPKTVTHNENTKGEAHSEH